jgi:Chromo (CHRromatin Organisation MOdifier) domain
MSSEVVSAQTYTVEKVLNVAYRDKKIKFLLKWEGWNDPGDNTWKPPNTGFSIKIPKKSGDAYNYLLPIWNRPNQGPLNKPKRVQNNFKKPANR